MQQDHSNHAAPRVALARIAGEGRRRASGTTRATNTSTEARQSAKACTRVRDVLGEERAEPRPDRIAIDVAIPKFQFRYGTEILDDASSALGIERAFDCCHGLSDFSGIAREPYMFIHGVYHQTFIAVDERGVEATAAAGVVIGVGFTASPDPVASASFHADRPFLVAIRDRSTNAILFLGRVADPSAP